RPPAMTFGGRFDSQAGHPAPASEFRCSAEFRPVGPVREPTPMFSRHRPSMLLSAGPAPFFASPSCHTRRRLSRRSKLLGTVKEAVHSGASREVAVMVGENHAGVIKRGQEKGQKASPRLMYIRTDYSSLSTSRWANRGGTCLAFDCEVWLLPPRNLPP